MTHKHRQTFMQQRQCLNGYPPGSVLVGVTTARGPIYHHKTLCHEQLVIAISRNGWYLERDKC